MDNYFERKRNKFTNVTQVEFDRETQLRRDAFPGIKKHIFDYMSDKEVELFFVNLMGSSVTGFAREDSDLDIELVLGSDPKNWNRATSLIPKLEFEIDSQHPFHTQLWSSRIPGDAIKTLNYLMAGVKRQLQ